MHDIAKLSDMIYLKMIQKLLDKMIAHLII